MSFEFSKFYVGEQLLILLTICGASGLSSDALDDFFDDFLGMYLGLITIDNCMMVMLHRSKSQMLAKRSNSNNTF